MNGIPVYGGEQSLENLIWFILLALVVLEVHLVLLEFGTESLNHLLHLVEVSLVLKLDLREDLIQDKPLTFIESILLVEVFNFDELFVAVHDFELLFLVVEYVFLVI